MGVASTTLRSPAPEGAIAARCSAFDSSPYSGQIRVCPSAPSNISAHRRISPSPGRKARMSPACSRWATRTQCATRSATSSAEASSGVWRISTGNIRPALSMSGASSARQIASASIVADISTIRRSGRSSDCASRVSASATSLARLRSWNSSKMTTPTPSSAGSSTSIRVRMPSVSTSIRVRADTRLSKRIRYPTVCPTGSPSSAAIRSAICRAASRRGSSIRIFAPGAANPSRIVSGSTVDLPAPGGAVTTRRDESASARFTAPAISITGKSTDFIFAKIRNPL